MKREIKFRFWHSFKKKMVYGPTDDNPQPGWVVTMAQCPWNDGEAQLMQFTGLLDKNGKEVFEGDLISFGDAMTADNSMGFDPNGFIFRKEDSFEVIWDQKRCQFCPKVAESENWKLGRDTWSMMVKGDCEVVGNIYENPELIKP